MLMEKLIKCAWNVQMDMMNKQVSLQLISPQNAWAVCRLILDHNQLEIWTILKVKLIRLLGSCLLSSSQILKPTIAQLQVVNFFQKDVKMNYHKILKSQSNLKTVSIYLRQDKISFPVIKKKFVSCAVTNSKEHITIT